MKASKGNKVYIIEESQKKSYQSQGFDITNDEGKVIEYGAGKTVSYDKYKNLEDNHIELMDAYKRLENKCATLEKEIQFSNMTVEQLKAYATENNIDVSSLTTRDTILEKIKNIN